MDLETIEKLLQLPRIKVTAAEIGKEEIVIHVSIPEGHHRCPKCGSYSKGVSEDTTVRVRDLSIFGKDCYLVIKKGRLHCPCSYRGYEEIEFVDEYQRQTTRFDEFLFRLCDKMTIMDASDLMGVNWKTAYKIDKKTLNALKKGTKTPSVKVIGVDEIAFKKRHKYFTIVYDITEGNGVLFATEDRKANSLEAYYSTLTLKEKECIKVVCMDMWDPFIKATKSHLPHADIVFDRFHIKKHVNECIDKLRRRLVREADKDTKKVIKNKKWVLLKNPQNFKDNDYEALEELKKLNTPLYEAYLLKEEFDQFFACANELEGRAFLTTWAAKMSGQLKEAFDRFISMLSGYMYGVLTFFEHRFTNAVAEGLNNKIKVLKRMAYGYRDKEYFKLKIYRRCGYLKKASLST